MTPRTQDPHVAIIGGGFSGLMTAVNLARLNTRPLNITLVHSAGAAGRVVAYSTVRPEHLLNVAARNMSALPDQPDHLLQWLRTRSDFDAVPDHELRERFIPRQVYGDYLRSLLHHHLQAAGSMTPVTTSFIAGEAVDIENTGDSTTIHLADGRQIPADRIVLACGNEAPAGLPGAETLQDHPAWTGNPWLPWHQRLPAQGGSIVILGTGLTTVDALITLRTLGWQGSIHAVSRHGWLPHAHFRGIEYPDFPPPDVDLATLGLEKLLALMEQHCARLRELGANPAIIVDRLRPHTQRIWENFTPAERTTFLRQHAARWNVLRHRIAPDIHAQITSAQLTGQLQVHAAGITRVAASGSQIAVHLQNGRQLLGDLVLNATGPHIRFSATTSPLLQNLLRRGLISPDPMDMGIHTENVHTVLSPSGTPSPWLLALGPLLRGTLWESIAVPELRVQARRVAELILGQRPADDALPVMMEYMI
ncbi:FAD/NAD(P)-binding protein [Prosthecobacter sp. SYSU 5D2]|uniref:FAD/NAD(P)-binding protein n=1 Tax=Prosthecobacter sp. SYSU 5D2 TaxID=3134134 RepID=UPI0031FE921A